MLLSAIADQPTFFGLESESQAMGCKMVYAPLSYRVKVNLEEMKNVPVDKVQKVGGVNTRKEVDPGKYGGTVG